MPQIDLKTTCPYCHREVDEPSSISHFRFCVNGCRYYGNIGWPWNIDGTQSINESVPGNLYALTRSRLTLGHLYIAKIYP